MIKYDTVCKLCSDTSEKTTTFAVVPVTQTSISMAHGDLEQGIELELRNAALHMQITCERCNGEARAIASSTLWPSTMFVEVGIVEYRNRQNPPVRIKQRLSMGNSMYELKGSIQMEEGHFYCIARIGCEFVVLDGLRTVAVAYPTFSAAVYEDLNKTECWHETSVQHKAIHILVFQRIKDITT